MDYDSTSLIRTYREIAEEQAQLLSSQMSMIEKMYTILSLHLASEELKAIGDDVEQLRKRNKAEALERGRGIL